MLPIPGKCWWHAWTIFRVVNGNEFFDLGLAWEASCLWTRGCAEDATSGRCDNVVRNVFIHSDWENTITQLSMPIMRCIIYAYWAPQYALCLRTAVSLKCSNNSVSMHAADVPIRTYPALKFISSFTYILFSGLRWFLAVQQSERQSAYKTHDFIKRSNSELLVNQYLNGNPYRR
jgi:hypothetical protein